MSSSIISLLLFSGCTETEYSTSTDSDLHSIISDLGLTGNPKTGRSLPNIDDPKSQLGSKLFFSKSLSGDQDSACVTCHHPVLGGGDSLSLPIGTEAVIQNLLGPGRKHSTAGTDYDGGPTVPRNAPTTFNVGLWDQFLLHDGRVESLDKIPNTNGAGAIRTPDTALTTADPDAGANLPAALVRFPVTDKTEMRGHTYILDGDNAALRLALAERLQGNYADTADTLATNNWQQEFDDVYGSSTSISYPLIADAIGSYIRSQVFVESPWKAYIEGDDSAISENEKKGALLFFNSARKGGANCASCHSGNFFTDESFHVIAMPQVGRGKGDGDNGTDDFGRFRETGVGADKYAFRTPSLLNTEMYGPWGHSGGYTSLEAVIKHHSNPQFAIDNYDFNQLEGSVQINNMASNTQKAVDQLAANRSARNISPILQDSNLTDIEISQLVSFLKTLTDPCVKSRECLSPWIPNRDHTDPDGLRINAVDYNGNAM